MAPDPPSAEPLRPPLEVRATEVGRLLRRAVSEGRPADAMRTIRTVRTSPKSVVRGVIPHRRAAVATITSGTALKVETVSHQGLNQESAPTEFFGAFGVAPEDVLDDVIEIHRSVVREPGSAGHVLTGPIHVEGAVPGDVLEVRLIGAELRVPYGINRTRPDSGVIHGFPAEPFAQLLAIDPQTGRLAFAHGISVPSDPFPGIVAVAPPEEGSGGGVSTKLPGRWGGNLDLRLLTAGSTLFLPVFAPGGQVYLGDPHSAQGDGEVNGTAVEHSTTFTVEVHVHRNTALTWPIVATRDHIAATGIAAGLEEALARCVEASIGMLRGFTDGRLTREEAYALCSVAGSFRIATAVNNQAVVYGLFRRDLFSDLT